MATGERRDKDDENSISTGGGAYVEGTVSTTGGGFVGRDKITINFSAGVVISVVIVLAFFANLYIFERQSFPTATAIPTMTAVSTTDLSFEYQVHVQDQDRGVDVANAEVRIEMGTQAPLNVKTDVNGRARIFIDSTREGQPALLIVEALGYRQYDRNIDLRQEMLPDIIQLESIPTPTPIEPTPTREGATPDGLGASMNFFVSDYLKTTACFVLGEKILVTAKGNMILGPNIGSTNPDGKDSFDTFGISIPIDKKYYIDRQYSLGELMCKLDTQRDWLGCGTSKSWDIDSDGCVEFLVNDDITSDNSGGYNVTIEQLK